MRPYFFRLLLFFAVATIMSCASWKNNDAKVTDYTDLVYPLADWRAQDYRKNQGVSAVSYDAVSGVLQIDCDLQAADKSKDDRGEILLDLKYVPSLECNVPVDMTSRTIEIEVDIPDGFKAHPPLYNGIQIFVKDSEFRSQYGRWENVTRAGKKTIKYKPSENTPRYGYADPGFDPTRIMTIGVKFAMKDKSNNKFKGQLSVSNVRITPSLPLSLPPDFSIDIPLGFVKTANEISITSTGFFVDNKEWFIVGGNWRVVGYDQSFGSNVWFPKGNGASKHTGYLSSKLDEFRRAGVTLVRVGLLDGGLTMFDEKGKVIGYNQTFRNDVSAFLDMAANSDIRVEFVLVDFLLAGRPENKYGACLRGRREVIEDPETRDGFFRHFLEPFLKEFGSHPALFGFDVINEPEWIISKSDGGGWETVKENDVAKAEEAIDSAQFSIFVNECRNRIRSLVRGKFVTIGVSLKYSKLVKNFDLDYYAFHYYPWMGVRNSLLEPLAETLSRIDVDKPWVLEEFPGIGNLTEYLNTVKQAGGAGALVWNLTPRDNAAVQYEDSDKQSPVVDPHVFECKDEGGKLREIRIFTDGLAKGS